MFDKTYELSLNKNYVKSWGLLEAVRELIQNAIDSESPFEYEFVHGEENVSLILKSEFTVLSPQTLLLGSTSKADSEDSIGSFGEGYKIALLVLTRLGIPVSMANGDKLWKPKFKYSKKFGEELLVVDETECHYKNKGLSVEIGGLSQDDVDGIIESCLHMQRSKGEIKTTQYGDILIDKPGKLFVGGLFICNIDAQFGYDIKPNFIKLERDRQTVSSWDLKVITRDMWFCTEEFDFIASLIDSGAEDVEYACYHSPQMVKEACYRLFKKNNPGAIAAENQNELKMLVAKGMERVVVVRDTMYRNVTQSSSYRREEKIAIETIKQQLERWFKDSQYHMHHKVKESFKKIIQESATWKRM